MRLTKVAIVFNPKGGTAKGSNLKLLVAALQSRGCEVVSMPTTPAPGSATVLAKEACAQGCDLVIAFGGDGTASAVVEGLMGTNTPMAVFPGGTGNLFARSFYSVPSSEMFVNMLMSGTPQPIDVIRVSYPVAGGGSETKLVLVALGLGRLSDAISTTSARVKRIFKSFAYAVQMAWASLDPRAHHMTVQMPGAAREEMISAVFAMNVTPPLMTTMSRGCNASDGKMDLVLLPATNFWHLLTATLWLAIGKPERSRHYKRFRTSSVALKSDRPLSLNIDGDVGADTTELVLDTIPGAVNMVLSE